VTSLEFSKLNPMILAVGLLNGDINIYDIRRENDYEIPVESSAGMSIGHSDPVWEVKWTTKGVERFETLVSISTDGKVLEWNMKKGFIGKTLMQLSRAGTSEGWISRQAAGLCISFPINDPNLYVVGTEEGYSLTHLLTYLLTYSPTHLLICLLTHLLTHSLAYSLTYSHRYYT
jgi:WD40 repeat protein